MKKIFAMVLVLMMALTLAASAETILIGADVLCKRRVVCEGDACS